MRRYGRFFAICALGVLQMVFLAGSADAAAKPKCYVSRVGDYICDGDIGRPARPPRPPPQRPVPPERPKPDPGGYPVPVRPICEISPTLCVPTPGPVPPPPLPPPAKCKGTGKVTEVGNAGEFAGALGRAVPGETIVLKPGNYGNVTVSKGGSAGAPVFISAQNPAVEVDERGQLLLTAAGARSNISAMVMRASNVTVCGIFFDDKAHKSIRHDGRADNITYLQNYFSTGVRDEMGVEQSIDTYGGGSNLTVQSNYFNATRNAGFAQDYGIALYNYNGVYVRGNVFDGVFNHQISTKWGNSNVLIDGNVFKGCGQACMHIGQEPDNGGVDWTGGAVTISNNTFIEAYTDHPQSESRKGILLRNQTSITVKDNTFQGKWTDTIRSDFMNRGGLARLQDRVLGVWGVKASYALIEGNAFNGATIRLTGRGIGPKNGGTDRIEVRGNTGTFRCTVGPWQAAEGKKFDMSTIDPSPPTVTGCP